MAGLYNKFIDGKMGTKLTKGDSRSGRNQNYNYAGNTPGTRDGALSTSQLHAQEVNPTIMKADHSVHDLDGKTPEGYQNPETDLRATEDNSASPFIGR